MNAPLALAASAVLLLLNGFFVAAEFSLLSSRRGRIQALAESGDKAAAAALAGIRELSLMLAAAQLGITMCSLGLGVLAEPALAHLIEAVLGLAPLPRGVVHAIGFAVGLGIVVFLHMVVGEMAPKSWAISHPEDSALLLARPFRAFAGLLRPAVWALNRLANIVVRACGVEPQDELALAHSPGDLALLLDESAEQGMLEDADHRLLRRTLLLSEQRVGEIAVPREQVVAVPGHASLAVLAATAHRTGHSRLLVYGRDLDDVLGVAYVKDVLLLPDAQREHLSAADLARPAVIVAPDRGVEGLLADLRGRRQQLAVVHDGTRMLGVITVEDVLEELVGDLSDHGTPAGVGAGAPPAR